MISRNPLLIILLNFLVGFLIAHGYANADQKDELVNAFADIIGTALIFITSIFSLAHVWKQGHMANVTKTPITPESLPTEPLPSASVEQTTSSDKLFTHHAE